MGSGPGRGMRGQKKAFLRKQEMGTGNGLKMKQGTQEKWVMSHWVAKALA